ncbi:hypothetical protein ACJ6WI_01710 [Stenotrophomonas maltophilia]|uniref:hypothetical protein n=1 Tax=Stenotrophomonas maltophilia TaxID=40324 RepID=UPI003896AA5E
MTPAIFHKQFALALVLSPLVSFAASACTANPVTYWPSSDLTYDAGAPGKIITSWATMGSLEVMTACVPNVEVTLTGTVNAVPVGTHGGYTTYETDDWRFGIQYRYTLAGVQEDLDPAGFVANVTASSQRPYIGMALNVRYVQLADQLPTGVLLSPHVPITYVGSNGATGTGQANVQVIQLYQYVPPPPPSCSVTSYPRSVSLGSAHATRLRKEGDATTPVRFLWSYGCNAEVSDAWVTYDADNIYEADKGTIKPRGGAGGGIMEVRRNVTSTNAGTPVKFGTQIRPGRAGATEQMSVRYIRTADPLNAGVADGTLKIKLEYY